MVYDEAAIHDEPRMRSNMAIQDRRDPSSERQPPARSSGICDRRVNRQSSGAVVAD